MDDGLTQNIKIMKETDYTTLMFMMNFMQLGFLILILLIVNHKKKF